MAPNRLGLGETIYVILDASKQAKRGRTMDAVAKMKAPVLDAYSRGQHDVCAMLVCRGYVIPVGIRLYVKHEQCGALRRPFRKTVELATQLIREFPAPTGGKPRHDRLC